MQYTKEVDIFGDEITPIVSKIYRPSISAVTKDTPGAILLANGSYTIINSFIPKDERTSKLSITPTYIFKCNASTGKKERTARQIENQINLQDNQHKNVLSVKARKNIIRSLNWLYTCAKWKTVWSKADNKSFHFKINFITLTIPSKSGSIHSRKEVEEFIYEKGVQLPNPNMLVFPDELTDDIVDEKLFQKCLNTWLTYARKYFYLGNYVWKIEGQKNGQLHIHLSSDQFINHKKLQDSWNRILQKNGLLDVYYSKFGNYSPNSTDVHSTKKMYNAVAYIGGYMKKDPNFCKQFNGKIWGCSTALMPSNKVNCEFNLDEFNNFKNEIKANKIEYSECFVVDKEGTVIASVGHLFLLKKYDIKNFISPKIKKAYSDHTRYVKSFQKKPPPEYYQIDLFGERTKVIYNENTVNSAVSEVVRNFDVNQLKLKFTSND